MSCNPSVIRSLMFLCAMSVHSSTFVCRRGGGGEKPPVEPRTAAPGTNSPSCRWFPSWLRQGNACAGRGVGRGGGAGVAGGALDLDEDAGDFGEALLDRGLQGGDHRLDPPGGDGIVEIQRDVGEHVARS